MDGLLYTATLATAMLVGAAGIMMLYAACQGLADALCRDPAGAKCKLLGLAVTGGGGLLLALAALPLTPVLSLALFGGAIVALLLCLPF